MSSAAPAPVTPQRSMREELDRVIVLLKRALVYWKRALLILIVGCGLSVPVALTRPKIYRSETVILYQETIRASDLGSGEGEGGGARRVGPRLREVLFSRTTLEPIIKDLNLNPKAADPRTQIEAVDDMRKRISFKAREGDTFEIAYVAGSPDEALAVTQRLGDCIIQEASQRRAERAKVLKEFLDAESQTNASDLKAKEAAMSSFEAQHPVLAMKLRSPNSVVQAPAGAPPTPTSSDPLLASLELRASRIDRQLAKAPSAPAAGAPKPVFQPPPDSAELVAAKKDLADKRGRFTDKHPDVIAARQRLKAAEDAQAGLDQQALDAHVAAVASANAASRDEPPPRTPADEAILRQQLGDLQAQIVSRRAQLRGEANAGTPTVDMQGSNVQLEVEFRRLDRDLNEARERQRQLDERLFKASITASSVMSDRNIQVTVLDPAYLPMRPISSGVKSTFIVLTLVVFLIAAGVAILSAKLDDRIYDKLDLERLDLLPIVGVIPPAAQLPPTKERPPS